MATYTDLLKTRNPNESDLTLAYNYIEILETIEKMNSSTIRSSVLTVVCLIAQNCNISADNHVNIPESISNFKSYSIRLGVAVALCDNIDMLSAISVLIAFKSSSVQIVENIVQLQNQSIDKVLALVRRHSDCEIKLTLEATQVYMTVMTDLEAMMMGLGFPGLFMNTDYYDYNDYNDRGWIYGPDGREANNIRRNELISNLREKVRNSYKSSRQIDEDLARYEKYQDCGTSSSENCGNNKITKFEGKKKLTKTKNITKLTSTTTTKTAASAAATPPPPPPPPTSNNSSYDDDTTNYDDYESLYDDTNEYNDDDGYNDDDDDDDDDDADNDYNTNNDRIPQNQSEGVRLLRKNCVDIHSLRQYIKTKINSINKRIKKQFIN